PHRERGHGGGELEPGSDLAEEGEAAGRPPLEGGAALDRLLRRREEEEQPAADAHRARLVRREAADEAGGAPLERPGPPARWENGKARRSLQALRRIGEVRRSRDAQRPALLLHGHDGEAVALHAKNADGNEAIGLLGIRGSPDRDGREEIAAAARRQAEDVALEGGKPAEVGQAGQRDFEARGPRLGARTGVEREEDARQTRAP